MVADDDRPLLSDFGRSNIINQRGFMGSGSMGSLRYMAPELFGQDAESDKSDDASFIQTKECDVYAFSMVGVEVSLF